MATMTQDEVEFRPQQHYWAKLGQLKFDLILYGKYFARCVFWLRFIRIGTAVLTAAATGAWMGWSDVTWIKIACPIAIFILQTINAGAELLPFESIIAFFKSLEMTMVFVNDFVIQELKKESAPATIAKIKFKQMRSPHEAQLSVANKQHILFAKNYVVYSVGSIFS